jgi:hypothetical protein
VRLWQWIDHSQPYNFGAVDNWGRGQFKIAEFKTLQPIVNRHYRIERFDDHALCFIRTPNLIDAPVVRSTPLLTEILEAASTMELTTAAMHALIRESHPEAGDWNDFC